MNRKAIEDATTRLVKKVLDIQEKHKWYGTQDFIHVSDTEGNDHTIAYTITDNNAKKVES